MPAPAHPDGSRHDRHLEFIRRAGETTRRAIAEHTGLSRSVVAQTVAELIAQGLVEEHRVEVRRAAAGSAAMAGTAMASSALAASSAPVRRAHSAPADASRTGRRGRPTAVLRLAHQQGAIVACDIGHAHITVAVTDLQARVRRERRIPFPVDTGAAATFAALHTLVAECLASCGVTAAGVQAFGVSFPYPVIRTRGTVRAPLHLTGWQGALAADAVPPAFNCPLVFDNDANFGLWGERMHGAGRGIDNLLYIKLADGIGAGLLVDGLVLAGARGIGGEMGHLRVDPLGAPCRCGNRGCLESLVSTSAVRRRLAQAAVSAPTLAVSAPTPAALAASPTAPPADFVVTPENATVFREAGYTVGRAVAQLCAFIDPEAIILGGQLGAVGEPLLAGVREAFAEFAPFAAPLAPVHSAELGHRSELVGIIDRALEAAWASGHGSARHPLSA